MEGQEQTPVAVGDKELKEAALGVAVLIKTGLDVAKADGSIAKLSVLGGASVELMTVLPAAVSGYEQIPAEIKDLSAEELADVVAAVEQRLGVATGKAAEIAKAAVVAAFYNLQLVKAIKG